MPGPARGAAAKAASTRALKSVPAGADAPKEKEPAKKAAPAKAAPAGKPDASVFATPAPAKQAVSIAEQRAEKAAATHAAAIASGETQKCAGPCGLVKPITAFPTTTRRADGSMGRGKICRADRDAGRRAAAPAAAPAEEKK